MPGQGLVAPAQRQLARWAGPHRNDRYPRVFLEYHGKPCGNVPNVGRVAGREQ